MIPLAQNAAPLPDLPPGPDLADLRPPPEIIAPGSTSGWLWLALIGLIASIVLILWRHRRNRSATPPPMSPVEAARSEIHAAVNLATDDARFATLHERAIRRLLAHHYQLPNEHSQTSRQLLPHLPEPTRAQYRQFFDTCESVKFASRIFTSTDRTDFTQTALEIINTLGEEAPET